MRTKTFEDKIVLTDSSCISVGSHRTKEWIVDKITFIGWHNNELTVISECVHKDDYRFK